MNWETCLPFQCHLLKSIRISCLCFFFLSFKNCWLMLTQEVGKEISESGELFFIFNRKTSMLSSNFDLMLRLQEEASATFSRGCRV